MEKYLRTRIVKGKLNYNDVINKYPQYKEKIDALLAEDGYIIKDGICKTQPDTKS